MDEATEFKVDLSTFEKKAIGQSLFDALFVLV